MDSVLAPSDFSLLLGNAERHFHCLTGNGDSDNTLLGLQRIGSCLVVAQRVQLNAVWRRISESTASLELPLLVHYLWTLEASRYFTKRLQHFWAAITTTPSCRANGILNLISFTSNSLTRQKQSLKRCFLQTAVGWNFFTVETMLHQLNLAQKSHRFLNHTKPFIVLLPFAVCLWLTVHYIIGIIH